jgi:hypothetical protein
MRRSIWGVVLATFACAAILSGSVAAPTEEKKPKDAKRVECIILELGDTYKLTAKEGKIIVSFFLPNDSAMGTSLGSTAGEVLVTPKKAGVHQIALTTASRLDGTKETENLTVVIMPSAK